jgi:hypothetical protein
VLGISVLGAVVFHDMGAASAASVCPGGFAKIASATLKDKDDKAGPARMDLYFNGSTNQNCAVTVHTGSAAGKPAKTSISLDPQGSTGAKTDSGNFSYYAGPVVVKAPKCVTVSASMEWGNKTYSYKKTGWCSSGSGGSSGGSGGGSSSGGSTGGVSNATWAALARCESSMKNDGGAPYYGYFQFTVSTWQSVGGTGYPNQHSYTEQRKRAAILKNRSGWGQWPDCSSKLGLR